MLKSKARKVVGGSRVRYKPNGQEGVVQMMDEGPGSDPRVRYPLFLVQFQGKQEPDWITYKLLQLV